VTRQAVSFPEAEPCQSSNSLVESGAPLPHARSQRTVAAATRLLARRTTHRQGPRASASAPSVVRRTRMPRRARKSPFREEGISSRTKIFTECCLCRVHAQVRRSSSDRLVGSRANRDLSFLDFG
jgi:hypothetical protein